MSKSYRDDPELRHLFVRKCRSCGQEIDIKEYGPEKICPHCGKVSAPANIKQAHVVFRHVEYGSVGCYINKKNGEFVLGVDYKKFLLSYILDIGNIVNPPFSNGHLYAHLGGSAEGYQARVQQEIAGLEALGKDVEVYLWVCDNDANSYLNMLYFSQSFLRFDKVYLVPTYTEEDMKSGDYFPGDSLQRKRLLSKEELQDMPNEFWRSFYKEYRVRRNGELLYYDYEDFDELVLGCMEEEFLFYNVIYSRVYDKFKEKEGAVLSWGVFEVVMWELLKRGKIESKIPCELWGDGITMVIEGHFRLASSSPRPAYSKKELLKILRDALVYGSTASLYGVLAEDAYLFGELGDGEMKEGVVQAIESASAYLIRYCKEKVDCVLCTNEKENFDPKHLCLLWSSEGAEGKRYYFVHADVSDGSIDTIRFLPPDSSVILYPIYDDEGERI